MFQGFKTPCLHMSLHHLRFGCHVDFGSKPPCLNGILHTSGLGWFQQGFKTPYVHTCCTIMWVSGGHRGHYSGFVCLPKCPHIQSLLWRFLTHLNLFHWASVNLAILLFFLPLEIMKDGTHLKGCNSDPVYPIFINLEVRKTRVMQRSTASMMFLAGEGDGALCTPVPPESARNFSESTFLGEPSDSDPVNRVLTKLGGQVMKRQPDIPCEFGGHSITSQASQTKQFIWSLLIL